MSNEIDITVKAADQTKAGFDSASSGADGMTAKIGGSIQKLGSTIGGEVGELVSQVGEGFDKIAENGTSSLSKLAVGGGVVAGLGVALQSFASKGEAAENQLKASVDASGESWEMYEGKVNDAVSMEAKYAHDTADTDTALRTLDTATGSLDTSLSDLNVTTDLAAARHESLATAAQQIALIYSGNTKILKQYGIDMTVTAGNTAEANAAVTALAGKLQGQAAAAADTFSGKIAAVKTEVEDWGEKVAGFIGGPLTLLGTVTSAVTGVMEISASAIEMVKGRHAENALATLADASAQDKVAASAALAAGAAQGAAIADGELAVAQTVTARAADTAAAGELALAAAEETQATAAEAADIASVGMAGAVLAGAAAVLGASYEIAHLVDEHGALNDAVFNSTKIEDSFAESLKNAGAQGELMAQNTLLAKLQSDGLADKASKAGISLDQLAEGVTGTDDQTKSLIDTWQKSGKPAGDTIAALLMLREEYGAGAATAKTYTDAQTALAAQQDNSTQSYKSLADTENYVQIMQDAVIAKQKQAEDAQGVLAISTDNLATAYQNASTALSNYEGLTLTGEQQALQFKDNLANLVDQVKQQAAENLTGAKNLDAHTAAGRRNIAANKAAAESLDQNTAAGRKNSESLLGLIQGAQQIADNDLKQGKSVDQVTAAYKANITQIEATAVKAGMSGTAVDAYVKSLKATPEDISTTIHAGVDIAVQSVTMTQAANVQRAHIAKLTEYVPIGSPAQLGGKYTGGVIGAAATGGNRAGRIRVGEYGPEDIDLPAGSHVNSNPDTQSRSGGGQAIQITLEASSNGHEWDQFMMAWLRKNIRIRGGNVQLVLGAG